MDNNQIDQFEIDQYIQSCHNEMMLLWKKLVDHPSVTITEKEQILNLINFAIRTKIKEMQLTFDNGFGKTVTHNYFGESVYICDLNLHAEHKSPILFMAHADTVSITANPFQHNAVVSGLGSLDMKGGIVVMLYTAFALLTCNYDRAIRIIITTDEEIGHINYSKFTEFMIRNCKGAIAALSFETASPNHDIVVRRAGIIQADYTIIGKAAHTGRNPENGIDAIKKAAEIITNLTAQPAPDTYRITIGKIHGGTIRNAIADRVEMEVDVRVFENKWISTIYERLNSWHNEQADGTIVDVKITVGIPASVQVTAQECLNQHLKNIAVRHQIQLGQLIGTGGAGDMAYATLAGVPALDQMGVEGEHNHTVREYAIPESLLRKVKLSFLVALKITDSQCDHLSV